MSASYNTIVYNVNSNKFETYDIFPYLIDEYKKERNKPYTFEEYREFIFRCAKYQWWGRCEYEIILRDWPKGKTEEKIDVYKQVCDNIDAITELFMTHVEENHRFLTNYQVVKESDLLYLRNKPGFNEHSYLILDEVGIDDFGESAYFVDIEWLNRNL